MSVLVETFEIEEQTDDILVEAEALALVTELGLEGQQSLVKKVNEEDPGTRNPYPVMTSEEHRVYDTICAVHVSVDEYSEGIIPLRVLQCISHATPLFHKLEIWHPGVKLPDPILVGYANDSWNSPKHIIARWGAELDDFDTLKRKATKMLREEWKLSAKRALNRTESFLANIDSHIEDHLQGGYVPVPDYRGA